MKDNIPFSNWKIINKHRRSRDFAFFGCGNIAEKTQRQIKSNNIKYIYDNANSLHGTEFLGKKVRNPENNINKENQYIIITSTSFREISEQLIINGLKPEIDFSISPVLNDLKIIDDLESINKKILFTSGAPSLDNNRYGGGIYEMSITNDEFTYSKIYSGNVYGLIEKDSKYIAVDIEMGIVTLDKQYQLIDSVKLPKGARGHGIQYNEIKNEFYICCSKRDSILFLNDDLTIKYELFLSKKFSKYNEPSHHCNDCFYDNGYLYVSMFSISGNWKNDIFDGGIVEIDIETKEITNILCNNLWMPHNITKIDGGISLLESLPGRLLANNLQEIVKFSGFARGLDNDGVYYYIGQSRNRNFSKNIGLSNNISIDAGIIIYDSITKVSRFLQLPARLSEIHTIKVIN
tara:strand:- start:1660 stop:2874 length:1215 start_codon:yes stop_codon:yes gene_type:complete